MHAATARCPPPPPILLFSQPLTLLYSPLHALPSCAPAGGPGRCGGPRGPAATLTALAALTVRAGRAGQAVAEREDALALAARVLAGVYGEYEGDGAPPAPARAEPAALAAARRRAEEAGEAARRAEAARDAARAEAERLGGQNRELLERVASLIHAAAQVSSRPPPPSFPVLTGQVSSLPSY